MRLIVLGEEKNEIMLHRGREKDMGESKNNNGDDTQVCKLHIIHRVPATSEELISLHHIL